MAEFESIRVKLENETVKKKKSVLYRDLIILITKISDYMLRNEKRMKKEVQNTMGGKVLMLASERSERKGRREGIKIGEARGEARATETAIKNMSTYVLSQNPGMSEAEALSIAESVLRK